MPSSCIKRINRAKKRNPDFKARCFYTGIEVLETATVEHLISRSMTRSMGHYQRSKLYDQTGSIVFASQRINNLIGNAPLRVKYRAREYLRGQKKNIFPNMKEYHTVWAYAQYLKRFLEPYRIHIISTKPGQESVHLAMSVYPWEWRSVQVEEYRRIAFDSFRAMLTPEELQLFDRELKSENSYGYGRKKRNSEDTDDIGLAIKSSA